MERLPLFPLNTVLFPHTTMPLHVFEERYKLMIGRCLEARSPLRASAFGVVLIRSGDEVGGPAEPHDIGTSARVVQVQRLPDGRMNLLVLGERRFRILALDTTEPYLQGDVEWLSSEAVDAPDVDEAAQRVTALFGEQFRLVLAVTGQWVRRLDLPSDPDTLADFVAGNLDLPPLAKQELLEQLSLPARLAHLSELLGERIRALTDRWDERRRKKFAGAVLN